MTRPLSDLRGPVRALFSDVDGTMTTGDRIEASTYEALERLGEAGVPVIMVTGRPAGFGHAFMKMTPVLACVTENGGVTFVREGRKLIKQYGVPAASLPEWRRRMNDVAVEVMSKVPGARLSSDSKYREVDLAIDWNEEVSLSRDDAETVRAMLIQKAGFAAVRSSVHVNFGPPHFDKLSACMTVVRQVLGGDVERSRRRTCTSATRSTTRRCSAASRPVGRRREHQARGGTSSRTSRRSSPSAPRAPACASSSSTCSRCSGTASDQRSIPATCWRMSRV